VAICQGPKRIILCVEETQGAFKYRIELECGHFAYRNLYRPVTFGKRMSRMSCFWCSPAGKEELRQRHMFDHFFEE
jgi:hypothetical protein